jgi:hypothetical protein
LVATIPSRREGQGPREPRACLRHAGQKRGERLGPLQIAQLFGVGRAHVYGGEIEPRPEPREHRGEVAGAVGAVLVRAEVQPQHEVARPRLEPRGHRLHAVVVEAEAVDDARVLRQPEEPRARVAGLREGRDRARLDEAEARPRQRMERDRVLVETRGEAHRIGQAEPRDLGAQARTGDEAGQRRHPGAQRGEREVVRALRVEPAQEREARALGEAHVISAGKRCVPSAPSGRSRTQTTSDSRSGA